VPQAAAPPRPRVVLRQGQNLPEVGLHQCPSERKGEGGPVRSLHVPSHVPSHPQNAAKVRGFSRTVSAFTAETDWLLEESGFEPLVPLATEMLIELATGITNPTRMLAVGDIRPVAAVVLTLRWDQRFESAFLQRRVRKLSVPSASTE
jgi:hypothetical protein